MTKPTKRPVRPAKTHISLGIRPVWSESSLCAQWVAKDPSFLHADSEDSDQIGWMPRLIWVFAGRTGHFVGFVTRRLKCSIYIHCGGARWLSGRVSDSGARGRGFETYRRRVVSLSKNFTPRKYWLITQEAVAPSRHDWKIVDWDVKPQLKQKHSLCVDYVFNPMKTMAISRIPSTFLYITSCTGLATTGPYRQMNLPGLLLLSRRPMWDAAYTDLHPGTREVFEVGYLKAKVSGIKWLCFSTD